jgi:cytochrome c-type biogenesis protein CcmH
VQGVKKAWPWVLLGVIVAGALVVLFVNSSPSNSPSARAHRLQDQLACPECSGESVADSNSVSARAIRADIPQRIARGESDAQIRAAYVQQYGTRVLLTPGNSGLDVVAWMIPALAVLLGACGIGYALWRWSRTPRLTATADDEAVVAAARHQEPADE